MDSRTATLAGGAALAVSVCKRLAGLDESPGTVFRAPPNVRPEEAEIRTVQVSREQ